MKKILLSIFSAGMIGGRDNWPDVTTGDIVRGTLDGKTGGMMLNEMRQCMKIQESVENAEERGSKFFVLSDEDYTYLVSRLSNHMWPVVSSGILKIVDEILAAGKFDPHEIETDNSESKSNVV